MIVEALEQTIRVLEDVKKYHLNFDLRTFVGVDLEDSVDGQVNNNAVFRRADSTAAKAFLAAMQKEQLVLIPHNCGCTACATGYAGLDPWFRERGFRTTIDGTMEYVNPTTLKAVQGWDALSLFYGITDTQANYLFTNEYYNKATDPQEVIDRIREVLTHGWPDDCPDEE